MTMHFKEINGVRLFRPGDNAELIARGRAEEHLRDKYVSGTYKDRDKINEIIQHQFGHFYQVLDNQIAGIASRHLMEFLLAHYDDTSLIDRGYKNAELSAEEITYWSKRGPEIRRAAKHLAEWVTSLTPAEVPQVTRNALIPHLDAIVICGEMLVELYILSDQTYGMYPHETSFTIRPEGDPIYWELRIENPDRIDDFRQRVIDDAKTRADYLEGTQLSYDLDFQASELDSAFSSEFGYSYRDAIQMLRHLIDSTIVPDAESLDVPFVHRQMIVDNLHEDVGWPKESISLLLDGFTVTKEAMDQEGRAIYKPKQEYRAFRRGFFEMPHDTGTHLTWSRTMARECWLMLMDGTQFQRLPPEWRSRSIDGALARLQQKAGKWFERQVESNLANLGAVGHASLKDGIGRGDDRVSIPAAIGELDYVGYFPKEQLLVVLEDKMVDSGFEPSYLRDDISSFVTGKKAYADQLRRKVDWVRSNVRDVCSALSTILPGRPEISPRVVAGALVTLYPTYASYYIPDYPCVALSELMAEHAEMGYWPFSSGLHGVD